jgi:hypothetical protein
MQWHDCPSEPLAWIPLRELLPMERCVDHTKFIFQFVVGSGFQIRPTDPQL